MTTPLLLHLLLSLSASPLNEVNKPKRLLPASPTPPPHPPHPPSLPAFSFISTRLPPPLFAVLSQHSTSHLLLSSLSLPPSFILSLKCFLPLFFTFFFYCHCCRAKAQGFPPSISQDRAAITAQERRRPAVSGETGLSHQGGKE